MADRRRSQRRLRQIVAQRLAGQPPKKPRLQECSELSFSDCGDESSLSGSQTSSPPTPTSPSSLPLPPPGLSCEEYADDEEDQSDLGDDSSEEANSFGTEEVEVSLSECSELISDNLSDDSSEEDCFEHFQSESIDSTRACGVPKSSITDHSFNAVFLSLVQRHNLTYACQSDLLKLFTILLPSPSRIPSSSHTLISKYIDFKNDVIVQHLCGSCTCPIESGSSRDQQQCIQAQMARAVLVRVSLRMQLRERFEGNLYMYMYMQ